jgi:hypothetical protein
MPTHQAPRSIRLRNIMSAACFTVRMRLGATVRLCCTSLRAIRKFRWGGRELRQSPGAMRGLLSEAFLESAQEPLILG